MMFKYSIRLNLIWRRLETRQIVPSFPQLSERIATIHRQDTFTRAIPSGGRIQQPLRKRTSHHRQDWKCRPVRLRRLLRLSYSRSNRWDLKIFPIMPVRIVNRSRTGWWVWPNQQTATTTTTKKTETEAPEVMEQRRRWWRARRWPAPLFTDVTGKSPAATRSTASRQPNVLKVLHSLGSFPTEQSLWTSVQFAPRRESQFRRSQILSVRVPSANSARVYYSPTVEEHHHPLHRTPYRPATPRSNRWPRPVLDWTIHEIDPPRPAKWWWKLCQLRSCNITSRWRKRSRTSALRPTRPGTCAPFYLFFSSYFR